MSKDDSGAIMTVTQEARAKIAWISQTSTVY